MSELRLFHALIISTALFTALLAAGIVATEEDPALGEQFMTLFEEEIGSEFLDNPPSLLCLKIFLNNLQACLFLFLGGVSFGLFTALILISNGVVIGSIVGLMLDEYGYPYVITAIVPHGIFEIPSFLMSGALGFLLASAMWREWHGTCDAAAEAARLGKIFITFVVPFVALAAFIEAFITPELLRFLI